MVSQTSTFYFNSYSFSSCDFICAMVILSSLFSSCSFYMSLLIFYSFFAMFFLQISMLYLYSLWKSLFLYNSTYNTAFSFSYVANQFFKLLTSKFKFPIFKLTIAMVWNNLVASFACITFATTSSIDFGILVCVIRFLDPFTDDPITCTNLLLSPNSNDYPFTDPSLLFGTCSFGGLNITKEGCVSILSIYSLVPYCPSYVFYCCCCKWCCKCWKCCELLVVSIQSSYMSPSKGNCFSSSRNLVSCSLLTIEPQVPPSSTLVFFLRALFGNFALTFFLFFNVVCISSLVFFTSTSGFCAFSFWWTNKY